MKFNNYATEDSKLIAEGTTVLIIRSANSSIFDDRGRASLNCGRFLNRVFVSVTAYTNVFFSSFSTVRLPSKNKKHQPKPQNKTTEQLHKQGCAHAGAFRSKLTDQVFHVFTKVSLQPFFIITAAFSGLFFFPSAE